MKTNNKPINFKNTGKLFVIFVISLFFIGSAVFNGSPQKRYQGEGYVPKVGFVPDSITACLIAEAVLIPVYGKEKIIAERPFKATLVDKSIWIVDGTLHGSGKKNIFVLGGTAHVEIRKKDGTILKIIHFK